MACGGKAGIVGIEGSREHLSRIDAELLLHPGSPFGIEVVAVAGCIDLKVGDAAGGEVADVSDHDIRDGGEKGIGIVIDAIGDAVFEGDGGELRCAGEGDLDGSGRVLAQEGQFAAGEGLALTKS